MTTALATISQDPRAPDFVQDPYPFYDRLRDLGEIVLWEEYSLPVSAHYGVVNALLRDRRLGRESPTPITFPDHLQTFAQIETASMLEREPPEHTRLRSSVMRSFVPSRISALAPSVAQLTHDLIDGFPDGPFDLLPCFAEKLPVRMICDLLGVPPEDGDLFLSWSHDLVAMYQARKDREIEDRAEAAAKAFTAYMREEIARKRRNPDDSLLCALATSEGGLNDAELTATAILLLNAGHEATVHAIGNGVRAMLLNNAQAALARPLELAEEVMRYDPPLHMFTRYALEEVEIAGHQFDVGDKIGLLLGAANRDPKAFAQADQFTPDRARNPHVALGAGIHFCLGAPLARLELMTALPALFERCPDLHLTQDPVYADRYHFRGLKTLMVSTQGHTP